jgi:predicted metalloprotease with PDZ domain
MKCNERDGLMATPWHSLGDNDVATRVRLRAFACGIACFVALFLMIGCASHWKGSVGAILGRDNRTGRVYVREVPAGMGAARAGVDANDEIVAIDGHSAAAMSVADIHGALAGDVGSTVRLTIKHGDVVREVSVERGPLQTPP